MRIISCILSAPYDSYLSQQRKNEVDLELKKLYANAITGDATEAAQMEIDSEEAADMVQLQELVNK